MNHELRFHQLSDPRALKSATTQAGEVLTREQQIARFYELTRERKDKPTNNEPVPF